MKIGGYHWLQIDKGLELAWSWYITSWDNKSSFLMLSSSMLLEALNQREVKRAILGNIRLIQTGFLCQAYLYLCGLCGNTLQQ